MKKVDAAGMCDQGGVAIGMKLKKFQGNKLADDATWTVRLFVSQCIVAAS